MAIKTVAKRKDSADKELEQWLNVRKNAASNTKEKDFQKFQNLQSNNDGLSFEKDILSGCKYYKEQKIAFIDKTPEPFQVLKKDVNGIFTGRFRKAAQPDFQGTLKDGRSIVFEAKCTRKDRILQNVLTVFDIPEYKISYTNAVYFFRKTKNVWDLKFIYYIICKNKERKG